MLAKAFPGTDLAPRRHDISHLGSRTSFLDLQLKEEQEGKAHFSFP